MAEGKRRAALAAAEAAAARAGAGPGGQVHRVVHVGRAAEVEEGRRGLPILGMEQVGTHKRLVSFLSPTSRNCPSWAWSRWAHI